jgi:hypothetical protein
MEGQTSVGRNAVEKMEELEQIGGARTWKRIKNKKWNGK